MVTTINIYKYTVDSLGAVVFRYTVPNLDNLAISYNTPISPMPLPEENAKENVLVKIEGNSATIDIDWTIIDEPVSKFAWSRVRTNNLIGEYNDDSVTGKFDPLNGNNGGGLSFTTVPYGDAFRESDGTLITTPERQVRLFLDNFESKSIDNDFLITIHDDLGNNTGYGTAADPLRFYGSPAQMTFNITGLSPVIYKARMQFFMGNVITVFDSDSPEAPQNLTLEAIRTSASGTSTQHYIKVKFQEPANAGGTEITKATVAFRREGASSWSTTVWNVTTGTNGSSTSLEKETATGVDQGYYVVYIPNPSEDINGVDNYNLTSSGHFNTTGYPPTASGSNTYTLGKLLPYYVKVYFHNTAASGTESKKTVTTLDNNA